MGSLSSEKLIQLETEIKCYQSSCFSAFCEGGKRRKEKKRGEETRREKEGKIEKSREGRERKRELFMIASLGIK